MGPLQEKIAGVFFYHYFTLPEGQEIWDSAHVQTSWPQTETIVLI